jgi:hypothetical protein
MKFEKLFGSVLAVLGMLLAGAAAQDDPSAQPIIRRDAIRPRPVYADDAFAAGTGLPSWNGSFKHGGKTYKYVMVGTDPTKGAVKTSVPVFIVPLKLTFADSGTVFDASAPMIGLTQSALAAVQASPIISKARFKAGTVNVGTTQYVDAFQRANFWKSVGSASSNYHVLLAPPTVLPTQSYDVPKNIGQTIPGVGGHKRGILDPNGSWIGANITAKIFKDFPQITPGALTIFLTYNVFPSGAYGFHDIYGTSPLTALTYTYVSYLEPYSQPIDADISTLAHEIGEWVDDPYVNNNTPCGTLLEVGDPLNTAIFTVKSNGQTWHPQDLAMLGYFSYDSSQSVNKWLTFRNTLTKSCQ